MSSKGMGPCLAVVGGTTKAVFEAYYEEKVLAPSLRSGQIVVMDNLLSLPTRESGSKSSSSSEGASCAVSATLLVARVQPHRGGLLQDQGRP
jgi:hypothetical protein